MEPRKAAVLALFILVCVSDIWIVRSAPARRKAINTVAAQVKAVNSTQHSPRTPAKNATTMLNDTEPSTAEDPTTTKEHLSINKSDLILIIFGAFGLACFLYANYVVTKFAIQKKSPKRKKKGDHNLGEGAGSSAAYPALQQPRYFNYLQRSYK